VRTIAVDWSGRRAGSRRRIWLAEARDGTVVRLEHGRTRDEVAAHLVELARVERDLVVGLDFSFSLPAWFLRERGFASVEELWAAAAAEGETWLAECRPPFWGRRGARRPDLPAHLRATEATLAVGGIRPKSTFQVSGAGSVGAGSIRGFPVLTRLRAAGFAIWPFDDGVLPVAIEIWPRALTGPVVKTDRDARAAYLAAHFPTLDPATCEHAIAGDDAFDAVVSALVLARHADALRSLPRAVDPEVSLEGAVWCPPPDQASATVRRATDASTSDGRSSTTPLASTT
jgi:hypothetical protein